MKIRRAYPSTLLEGKLSEKQWIDEFCDPADKAFASYVDSHQNIGKSGDCFCVLYLIGIICAICAFSVDDDAITALAFPALFLAHIILFVGFCTMNLRAESEVTILERKLCSICNHATAICNPTFDSGAAAASTQTADRYNDFLQFSLKFESLVPLGSGRHEYPNSYKVYHIEVRPMPSTVAASRSVKFVAEKTITQNSYSLQPLPSSSNRSSFR